MDLLGESFDISAQFENLSLPYILLAMISAAVCGFVIYLVYRFFYRGIVYSDNFNIGMSRAGVQRTPAAESEAYKAYSYFVHVVVPFGVNYVVVIKLRG